MDRFVRGIEAHGRTLEDRNDRQLRELTWELRQALIMEGLRDPLIVQAFALVREAARRTVGLRPFDVQLIGGRVLLGGKIAEMEAGEGKTLTATLPACTLALMGLPVHVITVNDYLAARDADWMGPVYRALGLSVGVIVHGMDPAIRRTAYGCDVTYCTNKEVTFDYLKDRLIVGRRPNRIQFRLQRLYDDQADVRRLVLRGLYCAIVDEADSVLVDEARTPLIISGSAEDGLERTVYHTTLSLAEQLQPERDFTVDDLDRTIRLTDAGRASLEELTEPLGGVWVGRRRREELLLQALTARHLFHRDKHYLVREGRVQLIDEFTGRVLADRSLERGLHQMIEAKEGCRLASQQTSLARITYQRFFRRYHWLAGMTGTAREIAGELWSVYRLAVVPVPTNRPLHRRQCPDRVFSTADTKWAAVVARIVEFHQAGRPVLVGTRSVAASEELSRRLTAAELSHQILNARQDREEAAIIARAGEPGRVTVATNMAGRGTDICLAAGVAEQGGLHVIATERHEAGRIDRQLFGRCGRQGDPGSYEVRASLEDELVTTYTGGFWLRLGRTLARADQSIPSWIGSLLFRKAQRAAERHHARIRRDVLKRDEQLDTTLAFSARTE